MDAARQMLDELMGRNRNLHPSEAGAHKTNWDDPDFCQYYTVQFCPHDLFTNTRADLGPCHRIHDDEAKRLYSEAPKTLQKLNFEDEFLRFCNVMLNDVDRKIQKGKQRLLLMQKDKPPTSAPVNRYQEQLGNLNGRIKKLLTEAEEAGIRGDVDQAKDLMTLCEQLKDERDQLVANHEQLNVTAKGSPSESEANAEADAASKSPTQLSEDSKPKTAAWMQDSNEKQMEVCEVCGAFLIVGDAQQRIEDHLLGKQHLGFARLRRAVAELEDKRQKERCNNDRRDDDDRRSESRKPFNDRRRDFGEFRMDRNYRDGRNDRNDRNDRDRRDRDRERDRDYRARSREQGYRNDDRARHHRSSHSHSSRHSSNRHYNRRSRSRSRSRSRY